jgi:hypothetical protein
MNDLVSFEAAFFSGKPFRHISMNWDIGNRPAVWFQRSGTDKIHVLGPDDIVSVDEAIPEEWKTDDCFEMKPE